MTLLRSGANLHHFCLTGGWSVDLESVYCYVWVDSCHVLVGPSKAIVVLREEFDECEPELCTEAGPNLDFVVWIVGMDTDVVEFVYTRPIRLRMLSRGRL